MDFNRKRCELATAVRRRQKLRADGKAVVLTNGVFDLLHRGHLYCLWSAVEMCRKSSKKDVALFIALNGDASVREIKGPTRPVQSEDDRAYALSALEFVNTVFIFHTPRLDNEIRAIRPDFYVKAGDYTLEKLHPSERAALAEVDAHIKFTPFLSNYSTTNLIKKIADAAKAGAM
jgi:rfaE bifunctional protein nucleotidyltransferase chain/domain